MRVLLVLAALVLTLAVFWAASREQDPAPGTVVVVQANRAPEDEPLAAVDEAGAARTSARKQVTTLTPLAAAPTQSRIVGRAVDDRGAPLSGAKAEMLVLGVDVPEPSGAASTADESGRFAFDLPYVVPADARVKITVKATSFHANSDLTLPKRDDETPRAWTAGDNDIGDVVLARSGTLRGRVLTAERVPVEFAFIELYPVTNGRRTGSTAANGEFQLGELPADSYKIGVRATGWMSCASAPIAVRLGETTTAPDIVLAPAPSMRGFVVDESGAGVTGVQVEGRSASTNEISSARTRSDGAFKLILATDEATRISVRGNDLDFENWNGESAFAPGSDDVRIVLKRLPRMRFFVVDEQRAPVERFEVTLTKSLPRSNSATDPSALQFFRALSHHPGGEVSFALRGSNTVAVRAPKYAPLRVPILADAGRTDEQTLQLEPAATISGRVLLDGRPCVESPLRLTNFGPPRGEVDFELSLSVVPYGNVRTNTEGEFEFDQLSAGSYALQALTQGATARNFGPLVVARGQALQLGDIELVHTASVRGVVLTGTDASSIHFRVKLDGREEREIATADGRFEFKNVDAGSHTLEWSRPRDAGTSPEALTRKLKFDVGPGEGRELVIDATPCSLSVRVVRDGRPVPGVTVRANVDDGFFAAFIAKLGPTDPNGVATAVLDPAGAAVRLVVLNAEEHVLGRLGRTIGLEPGGRVNETIQLETGTLEVVMPDMLAPVSGGKVTVWFQDSDQPPTSACAANSPWQCRNQWTSSTIDFGALEAKTYDVTITFERWASRELVQAMREPHACRIDVKHGTVTRIVVP